ncbi:hypothetical protein H6M51_09740 [Rhizobium sp. AQ_MP]|uniref:hypothetical protein n=1 Tax=Rhizobium sp. AQ_MP TaxID=2761536 RepID=UPI00163A9924|nr:hypothetical protein [Rhizobium sp. AQ_MP]MBC2773145.1 hypothetical protein [Rhizobium sp. AQ_MP]
MLLERWTSEKIAFFLVFEIFLTKEPRFLVAALDKVPDPVYTPGHATGNGADSTETGAGG